MDYEKALATFDIPQGYLARRNRLNKLEAGMKSALTYREWRMLACQYDELSGAEFWKLDASDAAYDVAQIAIRHERLKSCVDNEDHREILYALNEGIHGNLGGIAQNRLYRRAKLGTKSLIESYIALVCEAIRLVAAAPDSAISTADKLNFLQRAKVCFGQSALMLSGGAGMVYFHHGVAQALIDLDLLPDVLSGSSSGAWICGQIGTMTDAELRSHFKNHRYDIANAPERISDLLLLLAGKSSMDKSKESFLDTLDSKQTFRESFEHTGRHINISVSPTEKYQSARLLNAFTAPDVTLRSAISASCALPGLPPSVQLETKDSHGRLKPYLPGRFWVDGSMSDDLPFKRVSRMYGVNHFLVIIPSPYH